MQVLIVGAGPLATGAAVALADGGDEVTVIRPPGGAVDPELDRPKLHVVEGDPLLALEVAGAMQADVLVACTEADADNLVISLLGRRRFGVRTIVAQVNEAEHGWLFDESWGIDLAVSTSALLVAAIRGVRHAARVSSRAQS